LGIEPGGFRILRFVKVGADSAGHPAAKMDEMCTGTDTGVQGTEKE
jgi:hypothetical protein